MSRHRTAVCIALMVVALGALAGGCASDGPAATAKPTAAAESPPAELTLKAVPGEKSKTAAELQNWRYTVTKVGRTKTLQREGFVALEAKGVWLVVHVQVENRGRAPSALPKQELVVKDAAGKEYAVDSNASDHYDYGAKLARLDESLRPSAPAEVGIVFDVDPGARGFKLRFGATAKDVDLGQ